MGDAQGGCAGRPIYSSPQAANRQVRFMQKRNRRAAVHAYRCPQCRQWHVGTKLGRR